jgi:hypothetical protein
MQTDKKVIDSNWKIYTITLYSERVTLNKLKSWISLDWWIDTGTSQFINSLINKYIEDNVKYTPN